MLQYKLRCVTGIRDHPLKTFALLHIYILQLGSGIRDENRDRQTRVTPPVPQPENAMRSLFLSLVMAHPLRFETRSVRGGSANPRNSITKLDTLFSVYLFTGLFQLPRTSRSIDDQKQDPSKELKAGLDLAQCRNL